MPLTIKPTGSAGNVYRKGRTIKPTAANIKSFPGNFKLNEMTTDFTDLTTNAFYVSKRTIWAKG